MNQAVSNASVYDSELSAACHNLQAELAELEHLARPIHEKQVPLQQFSWLIKQIWQRLESLRASQAELSELAGDDAEAGRLLEQAFGHLQSGDNFSIDKARTISEQLDQHCQQTACIPEFGARIRALRALIAAIKLDYRDAATLYAQAAEMPGLDMALQWRYEVQGARVLEDLGRDFFDDAALEQAIEVYESEVLALAPEEQRPEYRAATWHHLGNALSTLAQRERGTRLFERAIEAFEHALSVRTHEQAPLDRAATLHSLGNALGNLAQRHADTEMLEKAVETFEAALEARTEDATPYDWALTQNSYATALLVLGQRQKDKKILKRASDAYKNVLRVWTRECGPMEWAATMNNLGTSLRLLGEYRKGPRTLEQAVAAYRSAFSERTRERVPQDWALTCNNLGATLHRLGMREEMPQHLDAAIEAYQQALEEWTRERDAVTWAMTLANLAAARKALAELTGDIDQVHAALKDFQAVGGVFREASHAQYYELVTEQIALLRKLETRINLAREAG